MCDNFSLHVDVADWQQGLGSPGNTNLKEGAKANCFNICV